MGDLEVRWGVFSLTIQNHDGDIAELDVDSARGVAALRTCVLVREVDGNEALGRFYTAIGSARHHGGLDLDDHRVITDALIAAGLPEQRLADAIADTATYDRLLADHYALVDRTASFGVPAIVLDGGDGPAIFGPVISNPTTHTDEARELWNHVEWLMRYENFSELKRDRLIEPDLESSRQYRASNG